MKQPNHTPGIVELLRRGAPMGAEGIFPTNLLTYSKKVSTLNQDLTGCWLLAIGYFGCWLLAIGWLTADS